MWLSRRSTDLFQKRPLITVVASLYYVSLAYCLWGRWVCAPILESYCGNSCFWPRVFIQLFDSWLLDKLYFCIGWEYIKLSSCARLSSVIQQGEPFSFGQDAKRCLENKSLSILHQLSECIINRIMLARKYGQVLLKECQTLSLESSKTTCLLVFALCWLSGRSDG